MNLFSLFLTSMLTSNVVLTKFLGVCPFMGNSKNSKNAIGMGLSVLFVVTISSIITYLMYTYILVKTNTEYLKTVLFILVIASMVQLTEIIIKHYFNKLYKEMGIYLPLIATNCAVLGITLMNVSNDYNLIQVLVFSIGSSLGFMLVIWLLSSIRERLDEIHIPIRFKGFPISFIVASIMTLLFSRYVGK